MTQQHDGRHTKLGSGVYDWEPFARLSIAARFVWLYLYSGPESRLALPGLVRASVRSLAEAAHIGADECLRALDEMVEAGLVEVDVERRIIRLTQFPDRHEHAYNGNVVRGWFTRFRAFPDCPLRNAHVETLRALMEGQDAPSVVEAWTETFASVQIPAKRRRGRQRFDSDTSTPSQPSLFTGSGPDVAVVANGVPPHQTDQNSTVPVTVSKPIGTGLGRVSTSSSPDLRAQDVPSVEEVTSMVNAAMFGTAPARGSDVQEAPIDTSAAAYAAPLPARPSLGLVPPPADLPFTPADLVAELAVESAGRFMATALDTRLLDALCATIRSCAANGLGLADVRVAGRWLAAGGLAFRRDLGPVWAAKPNNLLEAIGWAGKWRNEGEKPLSSPGRRAEPTPASAFGPSGRRAL